MNSKNTKEMSHEDIKKNLIKLLKEEALIGIPSGIFNFNSEPIVMFMREKPEDDIMVATPAMIPLFPAGELYDVAIEKSKEIFLRNLSGELRKKNKVESLIVH